ncbi:MAG: shikimate dehydrogenase family protein [Candidatus Howiella sp.]|jgi:shikimate dehydrogenase
MPEAFAVIGHPLGHTMSPYIHKALFALSGRAPDYDPLDIPPEELAARMPGLNALRGYNITIPHKQKIIPLLDRLDESAARYGAVNLVDNGRKRVGYNTDAYGFLKALETAGIPVSGRVLLCGCGGVARTMAYECLSAGCTLTFSVLESDFPAAEALSAELRQAFPAAQIAIRQIGRFEEDCDLLINATPVGMYPKTEAMPVSRDQIARAGHVFDAVYNPRKTALRETAEALGVPHGEGMAMLVWQAARAHEIWYGARFSNEQIADIIDGAYAEMDRLFAESRA